MGTNQVLFYNVGPPFVVWNHLKDCAVVLFCINLKNKNNPLLVIDHISKWPERL